MPTTYQQLEKDYRKARNRISELEAQLAEKEKEVVKVLDFAHENFTNKFMKWRRLCTEDFFTSSELYAIYNEQKQKL